MPVAAQAQAPATSFAELASLLKTGETVSVTNNAGKIVKGEVQQVSDTILVLRSGQHDLSLVDADVQRIVRSRHTLRNGALIGLAAGAVAGAALAASQPCDFVCFSRPGGVLAWGGLSGSIGMGVGAAVGASLHGDHVVFERRVTGRAQTVITPSLPPGGAGLLVQIRW